MNDLDNLVQENLRLVHACCHRLNGKGIEYEELYSAGCEGLVKAAKRFDKSLGFAFSTYAVPVILGEIKRLFRDGGAVKVSRSLKELSSKAQQEYQILTNKFNREPTVCELAKEMGLSVEETAQALSASLPVYSITTDENEIDIPVESNEEKIDTKIVLSKAIQSLNEIEQKLVSYRFYAELTQTQVALKLGMTQVQVSRLEKKVLKKMRELMENP